MIVSICRSLAVEATLILWSICTIPWHHSLLLHAAEIQPEWTALLRILALPCGDCTDAYLRIPDSIMLSCSYVTVAHDSAHKRYILWKKGSQLSPRIFRIQATASSPSTPIKSLSTKAKRKPWMWQLLSRWGFSFRSNQLPARLKRALQQYRSRFTSNFTRPRADVTRSCV